MTRAEIQAFFSSFPVQGTDIHFGASNYAVPTLDWLQGACYSAFKARLWSENDDAWKVRFQCRDFARAFASFCVECWGTSTAASDCDGLAVGEIWFIPDQSQPAAGHAICPAITDKGLVFIEPQTGAVYPMTQAQIDSRYFLRF